MGPIRIVGGGIGGLSAAIALARRGRAVEVHERADEIREIGAGIQLERSAMRVGNGTNRPARPHPARTGI